MDHGRKILSRSLIAAALAGVATLANASAFALLEQNTSGLGLAYAGTAALSAKDATTAFSNPAGLTELDGKQVSMTGLVVAASSEITPTEINSTVGIPITPTTINPGTAAPIGAFHYSARIAQNWAFGLSVAAPFGLVTDYDEKSPVRYVATKSALETIDVSPSLAYRWQNFSIAAGPDFMHGKFKINQALNLANTNTGSDVLIRNTVKDWATGWHAGMMWHYKEMCRLGVNYRSRVAFHGEGMKSTIFGFSETLDPITSNVRTPESVTVSVYHAFNANWALAADAAWTRWERFEQFTINNLNFPTLSVSVAENFKNTMRYALGVVYSPNDKWDFRVGTAFDNTPTNDIDRTMRIPDSDRTWAGVGFKYRFRENFNIDAGYAHLFFKDAVIVDDRGPSIPALQPALNMHTKGTFKNSYANIVGVQMNWLFS